MDYLKGTDYKFEQKDEFLKAGTDAWLLGSFTGSLKGKSVLDIGCGTGALMLYALNQGAERLFGIDTNKGALKLAKKNLKRYTDSFELACCRAQDFDHEPFDIIVCNPPFFESNQTHAKGEAKAAAMFDDQLPLPQLFASIKRLLADNGTAFIIYQADRLPEIYAVASEAKLKIMELKPVYKARGSYANRVLLKIKKGRGTRTKIDKAIVL